MGWKNWQSWLKGGVILLGIFILLNLIYLIFSMDSFFLAIINWFILVITQGNDFGLSDEYLILISFLSAIFYFLIGAIIGWLIGKFKK
ncbi:MAG: hypothetical protein KKA64_01260 [Nanoarchaeota archaeon]|nr:hypothetical protein [Nanoarchaeota archaeon]